MEHGTQGTGVQFVAPKQIYCTISGKSLQPKGIEAMLPAGRLQ